MVDICPSILATHTDEYTRQIERVAPFATRLHIDVADGNFAPNKTVGANDIWWPGGLRADVHVMYRRPIEIIDTLIALAPQLVILHAEADGDFLTLAKRLRYHGIQAGVALLPQTPVKYIIPGLEVIDHILLFSGDLGHYGGQADLNILQKVRDIRMLSHRVEIGWDGGVTEQNVKQLADDGVEVIVSGGYIQKANSAHDAYATLKALAG